MARPAFERCYCGKRGYSEHEVERALGQAQAKRRRISQARGTGRGVKVENRAYECDYGSWHLSSMSSQKHRQRGVLA